MAPLKMPGQFSPAMSQVAAKLHTPGACDVLLGVNLIPWPIHLDFKILGRTSLFHKPFGFVFIKISLSCLLRTFFQVW